MTAAAVSKRAVFLPSTADKSLDSGADGVMGRDYKATAVSSKAFACLCSVLLEVLHVSFQRHISIFCVCLD
jgi:hypothetical protein